MAKKAKRARSKTDKVVYSQLGWHEMELKSVHAKSIKLHGEDKLKDFKTYYDFLVKYQGVEKNYVIMGDFLTSKAIVESRYASIYVKNESILNFLENSEIKQSDEKAIFSAIGKIIELYEGGLCINLPNRQKSIIVNYAKFGGEKTGNIDVNFLAISMGEEIYEFGFKSSGNKDINFVKKNSKEIWSIVLNLFMYMDCFKECVIDGVPDIICKGDEAKRKKTITLHKDIEEVSRQAQITPHMRRGHFRFLQSDRYVNAKGKTVFVKPTMVKGKAKTVIEY